jgi:DNA-binding transcriptional LysR family regulator
MPAQAKSRHFDPPRPTRQRLPALQVFETVARHLSVTHAAAELFVTPGAVSRQVRQLEESLGFDLFIRLHRSIRLTDQGGRLAECLTSSFDRVDRTLRELMGERETNCLRLRVMPAFAIRWLVPRLATFHGAYPEIELEISTVSVATDSPLENNDFGIRLGNGTWDDVECLRLFDDALIPVCSPAIAKTLSEPADLARQTLLHSMVRPEGWDVWINGQGLQNLSFPNNMRFANAALLCQAAMDSLGVAIVQREYVELDLEAGRLVAPFLAVGRSNVAYYLVWSSQKSNVLNLMHFREWIGNLCHSRAPSPRIEYGERA